MSRLGVCPITEKALREPAKLGPNEFQKVLAQWLQQWPFEVAATLSLGNDDVSNNEVFIKRIRRWHTAFARETHLQLASLGLIASLPRKHAHILLFGRNAHGSNLQTQLQGGLSVMTKGGRPTEYYHCHAERLWFDNCLLQPIRSLSGIAGYIAHNAKGDFELSPPFGNKLLARCELKRSLS